MMQLPATEHLHHAYAIVGGNKEFILNYLEENKIATSGNPDVVLLSEERLSIETARKLKTAQSQVSLENKQFFLIECSNITKEAQNALLKVFEEPAGNTYFFLIIPNKNILLETLLSRLEVLDAHQRSTQAKISVSDFLKMRPSERVDLVKKLTDAKTDDKLTKPEAIQFLNELEETLAKDMTKNKDFELFQEIRNTRSYLGDQGSSLKMLLEHISLLV